MQFDGWSKVFAVLGTCFFVAGLLVTFHKHCQRKYEYPVFSPRQMLRLAVGVLLLCAGGWAAKHKGLPAVEAVFFLGGGLILWWSLSQNFIRTNALYGAVGSLLQLLLIGTFGPAVALLAMSMFGVVLVLFSAIVPVYVINRRR